MKKLKLLLLSLCLPSLTMACSKQKLQLMLVSTYEYNQEIFGTYTQLDQTALLEHEDQSYTTEMQFPQGSMMIQDGNFIFINPISNQEKMSFKVHAMPYTKSKDGSFKIAVKEEHEQLWEVYKSQIQALFEQHANDYPKQDKLGRSAAEGITQEQLEFEDISCKKVKGNFFCSWPITVTL